MHGHPCEPIEPAVLGRSNARGACHVKRGIAFHLGAFGIQEMPLQAATAQAKDKPLAIPIFAAQGVWTSVQVSNATKHEQLRVTGLLYAITRKKAIQLG